MRHTRCILTLLTLLLAWAVADAQRRVTPVNNPATATQPVNLNQARTDSLSARVNVVEITDDNGNKVLVDTITGTEWVDSLPATRQIPKMEYPLLYGAYAGVDIATPLFRAFGRDYGLVEISAGMNLHNRYLPTIEIGLGKAAHHPDGNNYDYRSPIAPFFRIGADYNFLYNSNPDYMLYAGVRYGLTPFSFSVNDITPSGGDYWGDTAPFDIPKQNVTAGYFQFVLGLRVRIIDRISLGWSVRYQSILHESASPYGEPWYIPGYGSRGTALNFTFTVSYTLPLARKEAIAEAPAEPLPGIDGTIETDRADEPESPAESPADTSTKPSTESTDIER